MAFKSNDNNPPRDYLSEIQAKLYRHEVHEDYLTDSVQDWMGTDDYSEHLRMNMYHWFVSNRLLNAVMKGEITEEQLQKVLQMGSTKDGLTLLAAQGLTTTVKLGDPQMPEMVPSAPYDADNVVSHKHRRKH